MSRIVLGLFCAVFFLGAMGGCVGPEAAVDGDYPDFEGMGVEFGMSLPDFEALVERREDISLAPPQPGDIPGDVYAIFQTPAGGYQRWKLRFNKFGWLQVLVEARGELEAL